MSSSYFSGNIFAVKIVTFEIESEDLPSHVASLANGQLILRLVSITFSMTFLDDQWRNDCPRSLKLLF